MTAYPPSATQGEKAISGALALAMHLVFFALLVFGVTWQKRESAPMVAELWSNLPAPKAAPPPPKAAPEPPQPAPKAVAKPAPKVEPKPVPKADIALRDKKEKERKAKERELAEKKKREEQALAEKKKREELARQEALKLQQAKEAESRRAREQEEALRKVAQDQAAAQARLVDEFKRRIADRIRQKIIEPPGLQGNPRVEFDVILLPGGEVLGVKLRKSSGSAAWDNAAERAILGAQPLPLPPDPRLFSQFRELHLPVQYKE